MFFHGKRHPTCVGRHDTFFLFFLLPSPLFLSSALFPPYSPEKYWISSVEVWRLLRGYVLQRIFSRLCCSIPPSDWYAWHHRDFARPLRHPQQTGDSAKPSKNQLSEPITSGVDSRCVTRAMTAPIPEQSSLRIRDIVSRTFESSTRQQSSVRIRNIPSASYPRGRRNHDTLNMMDWFAIHNYNKTWFEERNESLQYKGKENKTRKKKNDRRL
jgi:hypothetical protein